MSRKENRLDETVRLISKAIAACGHDFATLGVRAKLVAALREAGQVSKKRAIRERSALEAAADTAKTLHSQWWRQIEENVRKAVEEEKEAGEDGEISGTV
jgi:hypothetical protein